MSDALETAYPRPLSGRRIERAPCGLPPERRPLDGKTVRLEPLDTAVHGADLFEASHGSDDRLRIWDYLPDGPWPDAAAFEQWLAGRAVAADQVVFAIRQGSRASGMASYLEIQPATGVIEIGYIWFGPELRRARGATEALFLMLAHAMGELDYRRMQWKCNALNAKSRVAARRLGFRYEGIFYNHTIVKGHNRDTAWYSILDDEWPEVGKIIESWLAEDNFDADGQARRSLARMMRDRSPSNRR